MALALRALARDPFPSAAELHDLHRELRRACLDLRLLAPALPRELRAPLAEVERSLNALSKATGLARDRDVGEATLDQVLDARHRDEPKGAERFRRALRGEGRQLRGQLRRQARRALSDGQPRLPLPPWLLDQRTGVHRRFQRVVKERYARCLSEVARAQERVRRRPTARRFHELRIALRTARLLLDHVGPHAGHDIVPKPWKRLQQELGDHHDRSVLLEWLAQQPASEARDELRTIVRADLEARESSVRKRMRKPLPRLAAGEAV